MKTISFDPKDYKLVPIAQTEAMNEAYSNVPCGFGGSPPHSSHVWGAMLAAVLADLPGVVAHSGEPACWYMMYGEGGKMRFDAKEGYSPLYDHPPAQPDTEDESYRTKYEASQMRLGAMTALYQQAKRPLHEWHKIARESGFDGVSSALAQLAAQAGQECHICHKPRNMPGSSYCSFPHPAAQAGQTENEGMHASAFVKVWGDAGGGDAGRIALAEYAYALGIKAAQAGQEPVARIEGIDEYGPRLEWFKHWVDVGAGTKLYTSQPAPANSIALVQAAREAALNQLREWFTAQRKAISKGCGSTWDMLQCDEQIDLINSVGIK